MPRSPASLRWVIALSRSIDVSTPSTICGSPVSRPGSLTPPILPLPKARRIRVHDMNVKSVHRMNAPRVVPSDNPSSRFRRPPLFAAGILEESGEKIDGQRQNHGVEQESQNAVGKNKSSPGLRQHLHVGNLGGHPHNKGKVQEIPVIRIIVLAWKIKPGRPILGKVVEVIMRVMECEDGMGQPAMTAGS